MAAAAASGRGGLGPGLRRAWVLSGWALGLCSLLASGPRPAAATTHWVVTEDGKIQQQVRGHGRGAPVVRGCLPASFGRGWGCGCRAEPHGHQTAGKGNAELGLGPLHLFHPALVHH